MNPNNKTIDLLINAVEAALLAGDAILQIYCSNFGVQLKDDHSPLTEADGMAHQAIVGILSRGSGPLPPIMSEEGKSIPYSERKGWDEYWLVDPLDGTKEFIKRNGEFTVNIALVRLGKPVLGVVYAPVMGALYFAAEGIGAYKNEKSGVKNKELKGLLSKSQKLEMKPPPNEGTTLKVIASRSHLSCETNDFIENLRKTYRVELVSAGSSLKFCLLAEGKADLYPRFASTMEWDTAAGQVVVEQAGGSVLDYETGEALRYNKEDLVNPWFVAGNNACNSSFGTEMRV